MMLRSVKRLPPASDNTGPKLGTTVEKTTIMTNVVVRITTRFQLKSERRWNYTYLTPFNFRPPLIFGNFRKIKGADIFPKVLYNIKTKTKIKGAELAEGGRKLEGPKIKGTEN